jgi:hypothetical protein
MQVRKKMHPPQLTPWKKVYMICLSRLKLPWRKTGRHQVQWEQKPCVREKVKQGDQVLVFHGERLAYVHTHTLHTSEVENTAAEV